MPTVRPPHVRRTLAVVALALVTTSACSGSHVAAPQAAARAAASSRAAAPLTPSTTPSPGTTKSAPAAQSYLEATARKACRPDAFRTHAGLAGGALTTYVVRPRRAGTLDRAKAAEAADFAASELAAAAAAVKTCPPAAALTKVTSQASQVTARTAAALRSGADPGRRITASAALYADVLAQAKRLRLGVRRTVPTAAQLAG